MALIDLRQVKGGVQLQTDVAQAKQDITRIESTVIPGEVQKLTEKINTKADQSTVDTTVEGLEGKIALKADASSVYNKSTVDEKLGLKADLNHVNTELGKKADSEIVNTELGKKATKEEVALKADISYVDQELGKKAVKAEVTAALDLKADKNALESGLAGKADATHRHNHTDIDGLGTVATKDFGTAEGNIPVLGANGKLAESVLPSLAVNEFHVVASTEEAMKLPVQNGDIVYVDADAVPVMKSTGNAMTYMCVKHDAETFEEKFRPLTSVSDVVSKGELDALLAAKADKYQVATDIQGAKDFATQQATEKANAVDTKLTQAKSELSGQISGVDGKVTALTETVESNKQAIEGEVARVEGLVSGNTSKITALEGRVDGHDAKITEIEESIAGLVIVENVESFKATEGQTVFTIAGTIKNNNSVKVFVNGMKAPKDEYEVAGKNITWKPEIAEYAMGLGFTVEISYL